ncbi:TIGR02234 family membrane protein [Corynebacterium sp. sy039]|uniref:TIGR02234 family membrane protein n=1 Tax=Corynebacterium sp. sy039 TaxID=2599641 RepID=UPI001FEDD1D4|nr:TIGR02234 family membrane protein [Corynebacterium sp. sy039]
MAKQNIKAVIGILLGGGIIWVSSRMPWISVEAFDDKAGRITTSVRGALWSNELTAFALLLVAAAVVSLALRRLARRIIAVNAAIAAALGAWPPMQLLLHKPDYERIVHLLSSENSRSRAQDPVVLNDWAEIIRADVQTLSLCVALFGCALAFVAAVVLVLRPGTDGARANQYERKAQRRQRIREDLISDPESGRVIWDALDADIDPTSDSSGSSRMP